MFEDSVATQTAISPSDNLPQTGRRIVWSKQRLPVWVLIFVVAFALRGFLLWRLSDQSSLLFGVHTAAGLHSGDEAINIGESLYRRGVFADPFAFPTGETAHTPPFYPAMVAIIFRVFGDGLTAAIVRNLLTIAGYGVLFAMLLWAATALGFGRRAGIIAGMLGAAVPVFRSAEVLRGRDEWLAGILLLVLTVQAYRMCERAAMTWRSTVWWGLGWAAAMYVQPALATVLPIELAIIMVRTRNTQLWVRMRHASMVFLLIAVAVLPWTIRNYIALGGWTFMRDNIGLELHVSNGDNSGPSQTENFRSGWFFATHPAFSAIQCQRIRELGELEFNRRELRLATEWITSHRAQFLQLTLERAVRFWVDLPFRGVTFVVRALLSLGCFAGLLLMWRCGKRTQVALFAGILAVYPLTYYFVQYSNRYVAPLYAILLLPTAFLVITLWSAIRADRAMR